MKKILIMLVLLMFITVAVPLVTVFFMEKTIDNNPHGSEEILEEAVNETQ